VKALPLWQPWATLVAVGAKRVETRGYPPWRLGLQDGQRIAIHATKTDRELWICEEEFFRDHIADPARLPLGALVATCTLARAAQITEASADALLHRNPQEHAFGNYEPGRWAWVLSDVDQLPSPVPFRGSQGTFDVPDDLTGRAEPVSAQGTLL
jgi:hypothetical protein